MSGAASINWRPEEYRCVSCGGPRSAGSAARCRPCFESGKKRPPPVIGFGGDVGGLEIDAVLNLRGALAEKLGEAAAKREREPAELLADIIETVIEQDLITAVLDDE